MLAQGGGQPWLICAYVLFAGVVSAIGEGVDGFAVGQEIFSGVGSGGLREKVALTTGECRVALLVGNGSSNEQVAEKLRVSVHTVKSQLQSIYRKLGIHSRWQLADWSSE